VNVGVVATASEKIPRRHIDPFVQTVAQAREAVEAAAYIIVQ